MKPATNALHRADTDALQARWGARVAAGLDEQAAALPHEIVERLRVARTQALARARAARAASADVLVARGGVAAVGRAAGWWVRLAGLAPLLLLVGGLLLIQDWQLRERVQAAAEIDAILLADTVPPDAYADPGFVEFLKEPEP